VSRDFTGLGQEFSAALSTNNHQTSLRSTKQITKASMIKLHMYVYDVQISSELQMCMAAITDLTSIFSDSSYTLTVYCLLGDCSTGWVQRRQKTETHSLDTFSGLLV
jgi:hypothetical protein